MSRIRRSVRQAGLKASREMLSGCPRYEHKGGPSAECKKWVKQDWLEGQGESACEIIMEDAKLYKSSILPNAKKSMIEDLKK